jgi:hypothetical protein
MGRVRRGEGSDVLLYHPEAEVTSKPFSNLRKTAVDCYSFRMKVWIELHFFLGNMVGCYFLFPNNCPLSKGRNAEVDLTSDVSRRRMVAWVSEPRFTWSLQWNDRRPFRLSSVNWATGPLDQSAQSRKRSALRPVLLPMGRVDAVTSAARVLGFAALCADLRSLLRGRRAGHSTRRFGRRPTGYVTRRSARRSARGTAVLIQALINHLCSWHVFSLRRPVFSGSVGSVGRFIIINKSAGVSTLSPNAVW